MSDYVWVTMAQINHIADLPGLATDSRVHADGMYCDLPLNEYLNALALSSHDVPLLRVNPYLYWFHSQMNPARVIPPPTDWQVIGKAYHDRKTFGSKWFYQRYAAKLNQEKFPNAIVAAVDLRREIIACGGKPKSGALKPELREMLRYLKPNAVIWDDLVEAHEAQHQGKVLLDDHLVSEIERAAGEIENHPDLHHAFQDGMPEVSIFWHDPVTGIPCKARPDYLKGRSITELKTFTLDHVPPDKAIARAVANYRYNIQAAFYLRAAAQIPGLIARKQVYGRFPSKLVDSLDANHEKHFLFVFQSKGPVPLTIGKVMPGGSLAINIGNNAIDEALAAWLDHWKKWRDQPWHSPIEVTEFSDSDFPPWIAD